MAMLAFFPWLHLREPISAGAYNILPWRRADPAPRHWSTDDQATIDAVLSAYVTAPRAPVRRAAVIRTRGPVLRELDAPEREELFVMREFLAYSAVASRPLFTRAGYVNASSFRLIIQRFRENDPRGAAVLSRRRDGSYAAYLTADAHMEMRPPHVPSQYDHPPVDLRLLAGLLRAQGAGLGERLDLSLSLYNGANTDSPDMTEPVEAILMLGAFERLLDCGHKCAKQADAFEKALPVRRGVDPKSVARLSGRNLREDVTLRRIWLNDFCALRGHVAHGRSEKDIRSLWCLEESLLLASYAHPLLVRELLSRAGHYSLTDEDEDARDAFERLLAHEDLFADSDPRTAPWTDIIARVARERTIAGLVAAADQERGGGDDGCGE